MAIDFEKFKGTLPYASELFGVYQPLIGWRSAHGRRFWRREVVHNISKVTTAMARDPMVKQQVAATRRPVAPDAAVAATRGWLTGAMKEQVDTAVRGFQTQQGRDPQDEEWNEILRRAPIVELVQTLAASLTERGAGFDGVEPRIVHKRRYKQGELTALGAVDLPGTELALVRSSTTAGTPRAKKSTNAVVSAAAQAGMLQHLQTAQPGLLHTLLPAAVWKLLLPWVDPLNHFNPETQDAVLSPIGIIHLFRQYFFELDSFLGPAVGHLWVSPGGSLEVFELHSRRSIEQREIEMKTTSIHKSEKSTLSEDELATKVNKENTSDLSLGVSASGGVNFGVWNASASVNLGYQSGQKTAQETAHTQSRQQSEKVSNEMRRDFKTSFKTSVETNDTSSKRYTLANNGDKILNIELRRKMRQVGVQVQSLGMRMCWQVYVDEPGAELGVAELVHIAKRGDLLNQQPPEAPPQLQPLESETTVTFAFEGNGAEVDPATGDVYLDGVHESGNEDETIVHKRTYTAQPPAAGYTLADVLFLDCQGTNPNEDQPSRFAATATVAGDKFTVTLTEVNFSDQPALRIMVRLIWNPPPQTDAWSQYWEAKEEYDNAKLRAEHEEYVRAVRERVKLAGEVAPRAEAALRTEERSTIFRKLIGMLVAGAGDEKQHVTIELIRSIFDVEKMLYFVAESWWAPRQHFAQQLAGEGTQTITPDDVVGWGGLKAVGRDNYYTTEETQPARLGASIGWLLQLDGDDHRNAFLNSPFVKAVIPIRPGREDAALAWLERAHVEGSEGLDFPYKGTEPNLQGKTIREALRVLADQVGGAGTNIQNTLATEKVYETGFDPLEGGFRADAAPFQIFDQWVEVLPTEQTVAVDYQPHPA